MPENKIQVLHDNLTKMNPEFKVPLDQFEVDMQDEAKLQTLHSNLAKQHEDFKVPYEQFKSDMWSTRPTTQAAQAVPVTAAAATSASAAGNPASEPVNPFAGREITSPELSFGKTAPKGPGVQSIIADPLSVNPVDVFKQGTVKPQIGQETGAPSVMDIKGEDVANEPVLTTIDTLKAEYLGKTRGQDYAAKWAEEAAKTGSFATEAGARLQRAGTEFNQMLVNAPNTLLRMVNAPFNEIAKVVGLPQVDGESFNKMTGLDKTVASLDEVKETLSNKILKLNPKAEMALTDALNSGDFGTFGRNLAGQVLEAMPLSLALMAATPAVGATAVTAGGAVLFGGQKMKELDQKDPTMPEGLKALVGGFNGALEGWFESTFGSGAVSGAMQKLIASEGKTAAKEVLKGGLREGVIALLSKYPALAPMGEFYEEFMTQTSQNYVDILAGIKPNTTLFEGSLDAGLVGLASGGVHAAPLSVVKSYQKGKAKQAFSDKREQAVQTVQQNFDALKQPDGNLHTAFDANDNEVVIMSTTPGGMAVLHDGRLVDISDLKDVQAHPFESLFAQQIAEFDAANDPELQMAQPQVQSTFNWNGRNMQLTDVSDKNELLAQEIDAEGEPVGRPEPISMEDYRKVVEQQVAAPEATAEVRSYDVAGKKISFIPQGDGTYMGDPMETPEEAKTALEEMTKQIGAENVVEIKTTPGVDNLTPATYQLTIRPKNELEAPAKEVSPLDALIPEGEAKQYTLNDQPIERGKALARVKAAIFANDRKKIEGLDVTGDEELTKMLEKAFPVKITIGKKKATTEDALNWIDASDTLEELRKLKIEGASPTNDVKNAYALKVKELVPEVSPEESDKLFSELFAPEPAAEVDAPDIMEQLFEQPTNTQQDDNRNVTGIPGSEQVRETVERTRPVEAGSGAQAPASGDVQSDGQGLQEKREGGPSGTAEVRTKDQGTPTPVKAEGLKLFHGSNKAGITKFKTGRSGLVYLAESPEYAKAYGENVSSVSANAKNMADLTDPTSDAYKQAVKVFNDNGGWVDNEEAMEGRISPNFDPKQDETWELIDKPSVADALKKAGYDAVKMTESNKGKEFTTYGFFSPKAIAIEAKQAFKKKSEEAVNAENVYSSEDVEDYVYSIGHREPDDFEEGNLLKRIRKEKYFELKTIDIEDLDLDEWTLDSDLIEEYVKLGDKEVPPIVVSSKGSIIDGIHRANAQYELGNKTIKAYVGIKKRPTEVDKPAFKRKPSPSKLADLYKTRLSKLKQDNPKTYWSVDLPSDADLLEAAKDGRLVDMNGGMAYVTKDGDLKGLFKYDPAAKGTAKALQAERIKMGGIKLDAYDTEGTGEVSLVPTYKKNGFREVARVDFNPEYAPPDMPEAVKEMNPDVVVMVYDPEGKLPIKERRFTKEQYEDALAYRDSYVTEEPIPDHNKSGDTHDFFSDVVTGTSDKFKPRRAWEPLMEFSPAEESIRPTFEKFNGNFDEHIATSIPGFRDIQIKTASAINEMLGDKGGLIYDIGGSEGGWVKTITELSDGKIKSINLDANGEMQAVHNATPVEGSTFVKEAFGPGFEWDGVEYPQHEPKQKADVVHESMTFQFIDEKRSDKMDELVEKYIKPDGLFITEEKIHPKSQEQWAANEAKKDADFKLKYYDQEQISAKRDEVLTGMVTNQTTYERYKNELLKKFDYVQEYWDSGNFKGIVASNDKAKVDEFLANVGNTDTEFSEKNIPVGGKPTFKKKPFSLLSMVDKAAAQTDTNPSKAQIEAGNYQKGHVNIQGMDISIENPAGSIRKGTDEDGKAWETKMESHYGYFKGTVGKDGDHVDTFIGPNPENQTIFVVDQNNPKTGEFDESKVMLGYNTLEEAKAAYLANYQKGWDGLRDITSVGVEPFKKWLYDGARQRKPFGEYVEMASPIRYQAKKLYAGLETVPKFKDLKELTTWLQKWGKKNKVFASEEAKLDDDKFVKGLVKHTIEELAAFEELSEYPYLGFYDYDIPTRLNPELQKFAEKRYGYELSPSQVALYHLVSGFASPSADPVMDSSKGLDVFDRYMRTGELTSASDKPATVWSMNEMGKKVDTGVPKLDAEGNPVYSQVTVAYATPSLNKFRDNVLKYFKGDIDQAIDWISTRHSYEEISEMMNAPVKGKGSLDVHEYLTKEDGGFGIFGFTGAKLGSYVLNRIGNFSTVTKDLWYARTMARLTGEALQEKTGEALKLPWAITAEGRRKRALADKAWGIVADKLGITPADVQQKMWEFEKRLYEKIGAKGSSGTTGYASEGFMKRAKELEPTLYEPFKPAKPAYKKKAVSVAGTDSTLKSDVERWESDAKSQTPITLATEVETADLLQGKVTPEFEKEIRETGFYGLYANGEIFMDPTMDSAMALTTWVHEKTHIAISSVFSSQKAMDSYLEGIYDYIGVSEFRRVVPVEYWLDDKATKADEYLAHLAEDYITGEGKLEGAPEMIQELVKEYVESFTTVKYLQDEKQRLDQKAGRPNAGEADRAGVQEIAGNRPGEEGGLDRGLRPDEGGAEVDIWEQLFEGVPAYKLKEETINVDGVDRPVLNSKGLPIHATAEGVKNFWKWFGDSKVVDKEGRPVPLFHGTLKEFEAFSLRHFNTGSFDGGWLGKGFYATNDYDYARSYAVTRDVNDYGKVHELYFKLENPYVLTDFRYSSQPERLNRELGAANASEATAKLKALGHDGVVLKYSDENGPFIEAVAFTPGQIKSSENQGNFDPTDPRITFKRKPAAVVDKKQVSTTGEKIQEILVNNKLALKNWIDDMRTILPNRGIEDYENPLLKDALAKSKVTTKLHNFEGKQYKRLIASVADVLKTAKITKEELSHYLIAVHGVERNQKFWNAEPLRIGEDFSGLSELKQLVRDAADPAEQLKIDGMNNEAFADYYAKQIEGKLSPRQTKELWDSIRDISKVTLDELLDAGMISKTYYDELRVMYNNYIPLRAWEDSNPEEFEFGQGVGSYNAPIILAKGRKSLAEDPLATILQMANTAYISGERNRVKVAAGELVRNNPTLLKDFVQYNRTYFVTLGTDTQGNPIVQETIERPDQALFDQGLVTTKVPKAYTARKTSAQAKEFEVEFLRNGNKYVLVFQGSDPAVARAINNKEDSQGLDYLNKVTSSPIKLGKIEIPSISGMSRYLSAINTTYSIDFPIVNFLRDAPMAILSEYVYGDGKEALRMFPFMKDAEAAMRRKLRGKQDLTNPIDQQLEDFFNFGGPTGFAYLKNVDEFKASVKRDVRRINDIKNPLVRMSSGFAHGLKLISQISEWSETITRFAGYLNHIQQGESKEKAALAAKNLTVNFDQKGRLSPTLNGLYTFFNAAIQAVDKYFKLWGRNWKKMAAVHMFLTVQGFMNAMLLDLFGGEDEEGVKNYDKVSDYTKKNNLVIPIPGTNETFSFPVPQILRKFHAMGFDAYDLMTGKKQAQEVLLGQLASIPSDISPIDTESFLNGEGDLSIKPLVPSILKPIVELEANENFMKMPISPEPFSLDMARKIADTRRVYKDVNQIAQFVTDKMYELGGGDETGFKYVYDDGELKNIPALLDISPESIEHLFESYFGGVGKLVNRTGKTTSDVYSFGKKLVEGAEFKEAIKEINTNVIPVANRFIRTPVGDPLQKEFRKVRNDFENKLKVLKQAEKDKDFEKFNTIYMQIGGKLEQYKAIMTTFEKLDEERVKLEKVSPEDAKEVNKIAREQMQEIIKLK